MITQRRARGRPAKEVQRIRDRANEMAKSDGHVNKSRIARELHVSVRWVFQVLAAA